MKKEHVLIIGGSKGTGRTVVQTMVHRGYLVSVVSRNMPLEIVAGVHYWAADITRVDDVTKVLKEIVAKEGSLNHLVFCQQFRGTGDDWVGQIETSLTGVKIVIETAVDHFENIKGKNTIVFISSVAGRQVVIEQPVGYHVAKAGLDQMARYYAVSLGARGIRVNAIAPTAILKQENKDFYLNRNKEIYDLYAKISPLGRMVTAEDIANTVVFLCSDQSAAINGQILVLDGGVALHDDAALARMLTSLDSTQVTQKKYK